MSGYELKFTSAEDFLNEGLAGLREDIVTCLREEVVNLSFEKVKDGQVRHMRATLRSDMIPEDKRPKQEHEVLVNPTFNPEDKSVRVFDLDLNEWRSFRIDKLLTFDKA
jgi:hypothetical protein